MTGKPLVLEAFDKDTLTNEFLGSSESISFLKLTEDEEIHNHEITLKDKESKYCGKIIMES